MPKETFQLHNVNNPDTKPAEDIADLSSIEELKAKRQAKKDASLYDEEGRVNDPEIAHEMAKVEDPYRKRRLGGLLNPSEKNVNKGMKEAHIYGEKMQTKKEMHEPNLKILHRLKEILIEGLEKNTNLQKILKKSKTKPENLITIAEDILQINVYAPYRVKGYEYKPDTRRHCNNTISFLDNGSIRVHCNPSDIKDKNIEKIYPNNQEGLQELEEDIAEWAENSTVWGERKGLI